MDEHMRILFLAFFFLLAANVTANDSEELFQAIYELAQKGDAEAAYNLGMFYNNGIGTEVDIERAFKAFERSAAKGHPLGAYKLGCYYDGQAKGHIELNPETALKHKLVAANAGYSLAQYDVGNHYAAKGNFEAALPWWQKSAEQGFPSAILNLYRAYSNGWGVDKDPATAYAYFKLSAVIGLKEIPFDVRAKMDQLAAALTPAQKKKSVAVMTEFYYKPSKLTKRALSGVEHAQSYAAEKGYNLKQY